MAIKPIESPNAIGLVRDARASHAATARGSQRPAAGSPEAPQLQQTKQAQQTQQAQQAQQAQEQPEQQPPVADQPSLRFHVDQDSGKTVVSLVNPTSGEVLRQVPTVEALEVAKAIGKFQGMFVNLKV
jgi:flagellar protein FlaG